MWIHQTHLHLETALYRINLKMCEWQECGASSITEIEVIEMRILGCFSFLDLDFLMSSENCCFPSLLFLRASLPHALPACALVAFWLWRCGRVSPMWLTAPVHKEVTGGFSGLCCGEAVGGSEWMAVASFWGVWLSEQGNVELHHLFVLWKCCALF